MILKDSDFKKILDCLTDGVYITDTKRKLLYWNKAAQKISGYTKKDVINHFCFNNILNHIDAEGNNLCKGKCPLLNTIKDGINHESEIYLHHKDGHRVPVWVRATPLLDDNGNILGAIELFSDISHKNKNELKIKELEKQSLIDSLTSIYNRRHLESQIQTRLNELQRYHEPFGILFMDIDHFKLFNDTYGHEIGDRVLKIVASTLTTAARPFDIFGRWGGEEFVGLIEHVGIMQLKTVAERIKVLIEKSHIIIESNNINITISIGASIAKKEDTLDALIQRADNLMYESKKKGRNCVSHDHLKKIE